MESLNYFYTEGAMFDMLPMIGTLLFILTFALRMEFKVTDSQYGMLAEGDLGN